MLFASSFRITADASVDLQLVRILTGSHVNRSANSADIVAASAYRRPTRVIIAEAVSPSPAVLNR